MKNFSLNKVLVFLTYLFVVFLPLTYYGTIEVGFTIKIYEVIGTLGFGLLIFDKIRRRDFSWRKTPLDIPLLGFWAVAALSLTQAINLERGIAWWLWLSFYVFGVYYLIVNVVKDKKHVLGLLKTYMFVAAVVSGFALVQFFLDWAGLESLIRPGYSKFGSLAVPRPHTTFKEPLLFGHYLLAPTLFVAASFLSKKGLFFKTWVEGTLLLVFTVVTITTLSRGSVVALAGGLVFLVLGYLGFRVFNPRKFKNIFAPLWPRFLTFLAICGLAFPLFLGMNKVGLWLEYVSQTSNEVIEDKRDRAVAETNRLGLGSPRWREWGRAWRMFRENPVLGVGWGNYGPAQLGVAETITGPGKGFAIVNNEPLEVAAETGVLGLIFYLGFNAVFAWVVARAILQSAKRELYVWTPIFVGFLISFLAMSAQFLTFSTIQIGHFWFVLGLGAAAIGLAKRTPSVVQWTTSGGRFSTLGGTKIALSFPRRNVQAKLIPLDSLHTHKGLIGFGA